MWLESFPLAYKTTFTVCILIVHNNFFLNNLILKSFEKQNSVSVAYLVLKKQLEEMNAETQILFSLMLLNNSFHTAKLPRSRKIRHKERK